MQLREPGVIGGFELDPLRIPATDRTTAAQPVKDSVARLHEQWRGTLAARRERRDIDRIATRELDQEGFGEPFQRRAGAGALKG